MGSAMPSFIFSYFAVLLLGTLLLGLECLSITSVYLSNLYSHPSHKHVTLGSVQQIKQIPKTIVINMSPPSAKGYTWHLSVLLQRKLNLMDNRLNLSIHMTTPHVVNNFKLLFN